MIITVSAQSLISRTGARLVPPPSPRPPAPTPRSIRSISNANYGPNSFDISSSTTWRLPISRRITRRNTELWAMCSAAGPSRPFSPLKAAPNRRRVHRRRFVQFGLPGIRRIQFQRNHLRCRERRGSGAIHRRQQCATTTSADPMDLEPITRPA